MLRGIEFPTVSAKRFVGAAAGNTFHDGFRTLRLVMPFFGASPTDLCFSTLVSFVAGDFLAVVASVWAVSAFKGLGVSRFSSGIEKPLLEKTSCV